MTFLADQIMASPGLAEALFKNEEQGNLQSRAVQRMLESNTYDGSVWSKIVHVWNLFMYYLGRWWYSTIRGRECDVVFSKDNIV